MLPSKAGETTPLQWGKSETSFITSLSRDIGESMYYSSTVELSQSDRVQPSLRTELRRGRPHHKLSTAASLLASTVALVVIVTWLAFCITPRGTRRATRLVQRHLSGRGEDPDLNSILEGCLELREELGLSQDISEPDEPPEAKKARLFLMLRESGEAFERRQGDNSHLLPARDFGPSQGFFAYGPGQLVERSALVASKREESISDWASRPTAPALKRRYAPRDTDGSIAGSSPSLVSLLHVPSVKPSSSLASDSRGMTGTDNLGVTPEDWILEDIGQHAPQGWDVVPRRGESAYDFIKRTLLTGPSAYSSANRAPVLPVASFIPNVQVFGGAASGATFTGVEQGVYEHSVQAATLVTANAQQNYVGVAQPSTFVRQLDAKTTAELAQTPAERVHLHPFVRLPHVLPEDITQVFEGARALSSKVPAGSPMKNFNSMRMLFAKPSLTAQDVKQLMDDCRCLIAYACTKLAGSLRKRNAFYVVRRLATMFMVFDYVVSTIELLGDKMDTKSWWENFVGRFYTNYAFENKDKVSRATQDLGDLACRLSSALAIYKTGMRPSLGHIIALKREIFTNLRNDSIFHNPSWTHWQMDDAIFSRVNAST
ncbi:hypothetical protein EMWEY_00018110 [Eimeria maxima]|uniref:Uncharacterized protein n=1 Tax=Eimeria maxima TaxID=5804 RepID=U6M6Y7_EIMMA|nr:hypothetical protein EMWEY_00018110 [Eimeria maxima]CDJ58823.1 hypothetical protein EMWEY_00018110 [Eimeria maxima]